MCASSPELTSRVLISWLEVYHVRHSPKLANSLRQWEGRTDMARLGGTKARMHADLSRFGATAKRNRKAPPRIDLEAAFIDRAGKLEGSPTGRIGPRIASERFDKEWRGSVGGPPP